ncbi:hypothetical protein [Streptomyces uncialis]|uniref:hypothetical protein n=1 Tax=Streptomyces uncialis TaxID=1048205 RepID=UPI0033DD6A54
MIDLRVESADLDSGIPMMYRDDGPRVRMAYDPTQMGEAEALALLCTRIPRLVGAIRIRR